MNEPLPNASNEAVAEQPLFGEMYDLEPYEKSMRNARIWLYVIAGIQFAVGIYEYSTIPDQTLAVAAGAIDAFLALSFLLLALWSRKKPVPAFSLALAFYLIVHIGMAILDPATIVGGIIIKIFVIVALVKANRDARKYEEIRSLSGN